MCADGTCTVTDGAVIGELALAPGRLLADELLERVGPDPVDGELIVKRPPAIGIAYRCARRKSRSFMAR